MLLKVTTKLYGCENRTQEGQKGYTNGKGEAHLQDSAGCIWIAGIHVHAICFQCCPKLQLLIVAVLIKK